MKTTMTNPDHKIIKNLAARLLNTMTETPDGLQKVCNEMLPIAEYSNGFYTPNNKPPNAVYIELEGQLWRLMRGANKRWQKC